MSERLLPRKTLLVCALAVGALLGPAVRTSLAQAKFRGFWADAFHTGFKTQAQIDEMVARAVEGRYNAIVAEVLAFHDTNGGGHGAYWNSAYVPRATDIDGDLADPLAYLCQRAHAYGIEVHPWLVSFRVSKTWPPPGASIISARPEWIAVPYAEIGNGPQPTGTGNEAIYMLDPGCPEVQDHLFNIVRELVTNYEIDGINWDYIRYTTTDGGYPSDSSYYYSGLKRYQRISGSGSTPLPSNSAWSDFRRRTINELIRRCRAEIPSIITNPRQPLRLTADLLATGGAPANFTSSSAYLYFQNWKYWMEMAWLDAGMPMNYKQELCPSEASWYRSWINAAVGWRGSRHMYCGQGNYLNGMPESIDQLEYIYSTAAEGSVNYSYYGTTADTDYLVCDGSQPWLNDPSWYAYVAANLFTSTVSTPTMPWRSPATATEGTIWGQITTASTGVPVDDATVTVGTRPSVKTDGSGYYVVTLVPAATGSSTAYTLAATKSPSSANHPQAWVFAGGVSRYDLALGATGQPRLVVNGSETPITLSRSVAVGTNPASESFTIAALNPTVNGPVNYIITEASNWLSTSPIQGSSNGEANDITITYDTTSLVEGNYSAVITVTDAKAGNSPLTVTVDLTILPPPVPGDFDGDRDVDQSDFPHMQECLTGPTFSQTDPTCQDAKLDGDSDVDQDDMSKFLGCMTGPGIIGDPNCLNGR